MTTVNVEEKSFTGCYSIPFYGYYYGIESDISNNSAVIESWYPIDSTSQIIIYTQSIDIYNYVLDSSSSISCEISDTFIERNSTYPKVFQKQLGDILCFNFKNNKESNFNIDSTCNIEMVLFKLNINTDVNSSLITIWGYDETNELSFETESRVIDTTTGDIYFNISNVFNWTNDLLNDELVEVYLFTDIGENEQSPTTITLNSASLVVGYLEGG
jgi:hypothetical protein